MKSVEISKVKAKGHALLRRVHRTGKPILVTRFGQPVAQIVPPPALPTRPKRVLGAMAGTARILGDIVSPVVDESDWEVLR